jgi:hypothetical protein
MAIKWRKYSGGSNSTETETSDINPLPVTTFFSDSAEVDAFSRLRVSTPFTIFDSKQIYNDPSIADSAENFPLFFDNQHTSGSGTTTSFVAVRASTTLGVSNTTAGTRVRQTKRRFNYQPGKSQLIFSTFVMGNAGTGIIKRVGLFDESNGIFLENNAGQIRVVRRTNASGSPVDTVIPQSNWNIDKMNGSGVSQFTLDITKSQILVIDYEWLGVGRVRIGFVIGGLIYYVHAFLHANVLDVVYMSTPNLPIRGEISNSGSGAASVLELICSSAISEGGNEDNGVVRRVSTGGTHMVASVEDTLYAVIGLRLKSGHLGITVKLVDQAIQIQSASSKCEYVLVFNPTVAGSLSWTGLSASAIEYAFGATANTVTGGYAIGGGFLESGNPASGAAASSITTITNALILGSLINGTADTVFLCIRPIAGSTNVSVEGSITFREII